MKRSSFSFTILVIIAALLLIPGCSQNSASTSTAGGGAAPAAGGNGKAIFDSNGCARCHSLNGQGGRMGPDLTRVGSEAGHTADWLAAHVRNPKTHNPGSRMPSFEGKINDKDLAALGAYLAGLK